MGRTWPVLEGSRESRDFRPKVAANLGAIKGDRLDKRRRTFFPTL
jgi:hypothetical protein